MPLPSTYIPITTQTLTVAVATVTLSNIPNTYTDLVLIIGGSTSANGSVKFQLNGDTGTNYSYTQLYGDGTSVVSSRSVTQTKGQTGSMMSSSIANHLLHLSNYTNTTTYKTVLVRANEAQSDVNTTVNLWRSTAAINSIVFSTNSGGNFTVGTTFTLYGIKAA